MKIAFYLPNKGLRNVDCRNLEGGNPGIGGTEYIIQATAYYILKQNISDVDIILGAHFVDLINANIPVVKIESVDDFIHKTNPDYLLFKYEKKTYAQANVAVKNTRTKLIIWAHNFIPRTELTRLSDDKNVARIVCVSKEQLQLYRDHKAFLKSSFIYNGIPIPKIVNYLDIPPLTSRPNEITYIGSIVEYKGFCQLAKAWPEILKVVPDARLNVIGSGKLYDRNSIMGPYGIAEKSFEETFMPYLTDKNGNILPSVKFWGVLGTEKNEILKRTRVGVPNPSGISETFCITALEMQLMGGIITTINYGGFKNTVYRKTGILYSNINELASCIIKQLSADDNDIEGCYTFIRENFSFDKIAKEWITLFEKLEKQTCDLLEYENYDNDICLKIKEINRKIKTNLPFGYLLPTVEFYLSILRRLKVIKLWKK